MITLLPGHFVSLSLFLKRPMWSAINLLPQKEKSILATLAASNTSVVLYHVWKVHCCMSIQVKSSIRYCIVGEHCFNQVFKWLLKMQCHSFVLWPPSLSQSGALSSSITCQSIPKKHDTKYLKYCAYFCAWTA